MSDFEDYMSDGEYYYSDDAMGSDAGEMTSSQISADGDVFRPSPKASSSSSSSSSSSAASSSAAAAGGGGGTGGTPGKYKSSGAEVDYMVWTSADLRREKQRWVQVRKF